MFKTRLFRRYFVVYSVLIMTSILILGLMLMLFTANFIKNDKYSDMQQYLEQAVVITEENFSKNNDERVDETIAAVAYTLVSRVIAGEVYITDTEGLIIYYSNDGVDLDNKLITDGGRLPEQIITDAVSTGLFSETGDMGGFYNKPRYTVGIPVYSNGEAFGILFASCPADEFIAFLNEFVQMFIISAFIVLFISSLVVYLITARMIYPLKRMLEATNSFTKGDFSQRVPVSGYDEIGQLSMAFNNMASSLATTELSRRSFVANVSHELKTPMTTISGFVDGILDGTVPSEKWAQYLKTVSEECKRLSRLVRSMLDTSRIETGEMSVKPVKFDISETIRLTVFTFENQIEEKQLEIRGLETDRIMVYADRDLMHQVVYNLVENAVKFVNPGGYITFSYMTDLKMTYIAIRNSGEGIEKDEIPVLFDRFYKSDRSRGLNTSGVGLGLHIVRSLINYHKGEIVVRSIKGEYTEFEFSIPN